jgi:hypothetical protein
MLTKATTMSAFFLYRLAHSTGSPRTSTRLINWVEPHSYRNQIKGGQDYER